MNQALLTFLEALEAEPNRVIGLVITPPAVGTVASLQERYVGQPCLPAYLVRTQDDLSDRIAKAVVRMRVDNHETLILDLNDVNSGWLQATPPDYMLRSIMDGTLTTPSLTIKRIILVSQQKGFKLSPATMQYVKTIDLGAA